MKNKDNKFTSHHVGIAAEAIAAGQFARLGYHVFVQYGANQPGYDLVIDINNMPVKVSVKGSKDNGWGLTQGNLKEANLQNPEQTPNHYGAIDTWLNKHSPKTILCFVQFHNKGLNELPALYIATPLEVSKHLKKSRNAKGDSTLKCYGTTDKIPDNWKFSEERIEKLIK